METLPNIESVVVMSGGQDSATCLAYTLARGLEPLAVSFDYNQRHRAELEAASNICRMWGVPHRTVKLPDLSQVTSSALIGEGDVSKRHHRKRNLPASFVPGRNTLFLTLAHAMAAELSAGEIVTGVCQTDYSGYPDCRRLFIDKLQDTLNTGYEEDISINTPLMNLTKAETFALAELCGKDKALDIIHHSLTCYNGITSQEFAWGRGCGECPACDLRQRGYHDYLEDRPSHLNNVASMFAAPFSRQL